ncbi:MAG: flavin reductase family protein [Actinomycetota bacterium]|nr:flavin reductase family protein [Actinomycetota bacterium]
MSQDAGRAPVGPFPPALADEEGRRSYDRLRRRVLWRMPGGIYVLGARDGNRRNLMTLNWAIQLAVEPKLLGASVEKTALTWELVHAGRVFSLSVLARGDRALARKFVKPVLDEGGLLNGYAVHEVATGAPVLDCAMAFLDCCVREEVDCGSHTLFVGEVQAAGFLAAEDTPVLRMEDTRMSYGG